MTPHREVRAVYDAETIRVYQAYSDEIADAALAAGTFVAPFKRDRMTWIKPSFLWMMYRSGWASKDAGQQRVLAIDITRTGFEWALRYSCLSDTAARLGKDEARRLMNASPVRVQWDPERDLHFNPLGHRSIQIGLAGNAVDHYLDDGSESIAWPSSRSASVAVSCWVIGSSRTTVEPRSTSSRSVSSQICSGCPTLGSSNGSSTPN